MPRQSEEEIVSRMIVDEQQPAARQAAHLLGPAPGMEDVKGQKEQAMWNYRDPSVTPEAMAQMYVQAMNEGLDHQDALGLVTLKAYKNRGQMLLAVGDDPKEQAAYARKMRGQAAIDTTANELTPGPQQPEAGGY